MILNKNSGDDLARRFNDILNKNIKKFAMEKKEAPHGMGAMADDVKDEDDAITNMLLDNHLEGDAMTNHLEGDAMTNHLEGDLKDDAYTSHLKDDAYTSHLKDDALTNDGHHPMTAEAQRIMSGLGKIAGSLKRKGEVFAADVVEATALSIRDDFRKEAAIKKSASLQRNRKSSVLSELNDMADRLISKGNLKAAKEVIKTASKISKS